MHVEDETAWLEEMADQFPGHLVVAADVRERRVVTRGWAHTLPKDIMDAVEELNGLPLSGLLVTAVHKEGQMQGPDLSGAEATLRTGRGFVIHRAAVFACGLEELLDVTLEVTKRIASPGFP